MLLMVEHEFLILEGGDTREAWDEVRARSSQPPKKEMELANSPKLQRLKPADPAASPDLIDAESKTQESVSSMEPKVLFTSVKKEDLCVNEDTLEVGNEEADAKKDEDTKISGEIDVKRETDLKKSKDESAIPDTD
jgi:hypothetical protein